MGMKIWPYEKFTRMLDTLIEMKADEPEAPAGRRGAGLAHTKQPAAEADLQQLLKNEKNMHSGQLPWSEVVPFRAYFVYVHDVEEKNRPVMMREYPRPKDNEESEWPQLHASAIPRCPFVADSSRKRESTEQAAAETQTITEAPRTRAASAAIDNARSKPAALERKQSTETVRSRQQVTIPPQPKPPQAHVFEPPQLKHAASNTTTDSLPAHLTNRFHYQGIPRAGTGREPLASGLQRSNQTSAIQSQMVSSTAANPVARMGGKSKEFHELQRRAVEQRRSGLSVNSVPSSYMNDVRAAINHDQNSIPERGSRRRAPAALTKIYEDETQSDDDGEEDEEEEESSSQQQQQKPSRAASAKQKKNKKAEREPKPGYCENCRDKYDDFQEHVMSKKHRKFATTAENWKELDGLLKKLTRK